MKFQLMAVFPLFLLLVATTALIGQDDKANRPSPPAVAKGMVGDAEISINYSSPAVKERKIWGGLVPYGKVWRTGANECTVLETTADISVNGSKLAAGRYGLFTIPGEETWTVIFNSDADQWGAYKYKEKEDVLRITATPRPGEFRERMQFTIAGNQIVLAWENLELPISVE